MYIVLALVALAASCHAEDLWVGLRIYDLDGNGKQTITYVACQISEADMKRIQEGGSPDGFVVAKNVLYVDSDDGTYEMNSEGKYSVEESDTILYKAKSLYQVVMLKGDPRKILKKKTKDHAVEKGDAKW